MDARDWGRSVFAVGLMVLVMLAAAVTVIAAIDVVFLVLLGVLLAVCFCRTAMLISSNTRLPYGFSLALVVLLLIGGMVGAGGFLGSRIETQLDEAENKMDEALAELRANLQEHPRLNAFLQTLPYLGGFLQQESSSSDTSSASEQQAGEPRSSGPPSQFTPSIQQLESSKEQQFYQQAGAISSQFLPVAQGTLGMLGQVFAKTIGLLTASAVIFFVGIFLAVDPSLYKTGVVWLFPLPARERASAVMDELGDTLWRWLLGRLLSMLITGAGTGVILWLLGVPLPLTLGVLTGALTFIPNIGAAIALALAFLLALPVGALTAAWVVVAYLILQLLESNVITPLVQQHQVAIPPALLIAFQLLIGTLTGFLGVMVATPLLAVIMVVIKRVYVEDVLGDRLAA